jgi:citrate synthase
MMLTTEEAAGRLGVKVDTVYAYVSRGVLHPRRTGGTRRSLFNADEVEEVARRGRPRRGSRPMVLDLVVESGLTTIGDRGFRYRGRDVLTLARTQSFEQVAHWLWTGQEPEREAPWAAYAITVPDLPQARDRLRAAVVLSSAAEPFRADLAPSAVTGAARALIASMVSAVSSSGGHGGRAARLPLGRAAPLRDTIAGRLWARLGAGRPVPALVTARSPTTSLPPRRWPRGWRRRSGPIRSPSSSPGSARCPVPCTAGPAR